MDKKKRLKKIKSLEKQKETHKRKIEAYKGSKDFLILYWEKQILDFEKQIDLEKKKIK